MILKIFTTIIIGWLTILVANQKVVIYLPNVGLQSNFTTPNQYLFMLGKPIDKQMIQNASSMGPIRFEINQLILGQILMKDYRDWLVSDNIMPIIPYKKHFLLPSPLGIRVGGISDYIGDNIQDFNNIIVPYIDYQNRVLDYLNKHALSYIDLINTINQTPQDSRTTNEAITNPYQDKFTPDIYAIALYLKKPNGEIYIIEKQDNQNQLYYEIEPNLTIAINVTLYKYDTVFKQFDILQEITSISNKIDSGYKPPVIKVTNIENKRIKRQVAIDFMRKYTMVLHHLRKQLANTPPFSTIKNPSNDNIDNNTDNLSIDNNTSDLTVDNNSSVIVDTSTPMNFYDQEAKVTNSSNDNIVFEVTTPAMANDWLNTDQPLRSYQQEMPIGLARIHDANPTNLQATMIYGDAIVGQSLKPIPYSGSELSLYSGIDYFQRNIAYEGTKDINRTAIEPFGGLSYSANVGYKLGWNWLSHTYFNMYAEGKYGFTNANSTNFFFSQLNIGLGVEKRFLTNFGLYWSLFADINEYISMMTKKNKPIFSFETGSKIGGKIGYYWTPYWLIEGALGYNYGIRTNTQHTKNIYQRKNPLFGYIGIKMLFE